MMWEDLIPLPSFIVTSTDATAHTIMGTVDQFVLLRSSFVLLSLSERINQSTTTPANKTRSCIQIGRTPSPQNGAYRTIKPHSMLHSQTFQHPFFLQTCGWQAHTMKVNPERP
jgi:hypothetical protein